MPKYDVYLKEPNSNPFVERLTRPVFRGIEADSPEQVKSLFKEFQQSDRGKDFRDHRIDEIRPVD